MRKSDSKSFSILESTLERHSGKITVSGKPDAVFFYPWINAEERSRIWIL